MLFTVTASFSDFTKAYEQYDVESPIAALVRFLTEAEALAEYDRELRARLIPMDGYRLIHVAGGLRGVWLWHLTDELEHDDVALYGGAIVQTDPNGPRRE